MEELARRGIRTLAVDLRGWSGERTEVHYRSFLSYPFTFFWEVVASFHVRGHGESPLGDPKDFSPQQLAADVRATLKAGGEGGGMYSCRSLVQSWKN